MIATKNKELRAVEQERQALQSSLKTFRSHPSAPAKLRIHVGDSPVDFRLSRSGQLEELPPVGVWGWAKGMGYQELRKFLTHQGYKVELIPAD